MKSNLLKYTHIASFIIALLFSINGATQENDASNYKMLFNFKTVKQNDNSRLLEVRFIAKNRKNRKDKIPVYDAEIKFFTILNNEKKILGTAKTSKEGIAQITLPKNQKYLIDKEGNIHLTAHFEGTNAIDRREKKITIKDLQLELNLTEIDSVKTVLVKAFTIDSLGVDTPVDNVDLFIAIGGMLSKMKLEEGSITNGEFKYEFPTDIPGDVNGNITVYTIIEDHEQFGNIIQNKTINWGVFNKQITEEKNTLWSDAAPIWMYIVLTILLGGVWINYIYSIINLIKIKKEGEIIELKLEQ